MRTQTGFVVEAPHGLDELERADTIVVPGLVGSRRRAVGRAEGGARRRARARRPARVALHRRVRARRRRPPRRPPRDDALDVRRAPAARYPRVALDPERPLRRRRTTSSRRRGRLRHRPVPATSSPLDHGVDVAATVARRLVMPLYRSGGQAQYVDKPVASGADGPGRAARLGAREPRRRRHGRRSRPPRRDEPADPDAPLPRVGRHAAGRVAPARAASARPAAARVDRRPGRRRRAPSRVRLAATMRAQFAARLDTSPRAYPKKERRTAST